MTSLQGAQTARAQQGLDRSGADGSQGGTAKVQAAPVRKEAEITFAGFVQHDDGRSTVFVELSRAVEVVASKAQRTLTYTLKDAKVVIRNNRNPLLTSHFPSVVASARLIPEKGATKLVIRLREDAAPVHRMVSRGQGAALEVDFPAPKQAP